MEKIKDFLEFVRISKCNRTFETYDYVLNDFQGYIKKPKESANETEIINYLTQRIGLNLVSKRMFLTIIKVFFGYCLNHLQRGVTIEEIRQELSLRSQYEIIRNLKPSNLKGEDKLPKEKIFSIIFFAKMLKNAKGKDFDVIYLLGYFGLRRKELLGILSENIDFKSNKLNIKTAKTNMWRTLSFNDYTSNVIKRFLKYKDTLKSYNVNSLLLKFSKIVGWRLHPHSFRHFFNTQMVNQTKNPILVKHLMGHSVGRDMTSLYYHITPEMLQKAMIEEHFMNGIIQGEKYG